MNIVRNTIAILVLLGLAACGGSGAGGSYGSGSAPPPPPPSPPPTPTPTPKPNAKIIITNETTGLSGNEHSWLYEYDSQGMPLKITRYRPNGSPDITTDIYYNAVVQTGVINNHNVGSTLNYDADLFNKQLPYMAKVSSTLDGITQVNYKQYFFFYDDKDRLIKVGEQTNAAGDREFDLHIFYDDKNNVTALQYELTTGPNEVIPPVTVAAYDDKPTPYASINIWKFLMINFNWDNYDPEPILTALSSNNPLDYTLDTFKRTMTYKYNEHGFPIERSNTNTNPNGVYTFTQTFSYACN